MTTGLPGAPYPLGATITAGGTNFAVASDVASGMTLCLFDSSGRETQVPMLDFDAGVWHTLVPGVGAGQAYGFRAAGPYDPAQGIRCNPAKLLLDPYARAVAGSVTDNPDVLGYVGGDADTPSDTDSAPDVPRSLVVDPAYGWREHEPIRRPYADTVIYEVHVKGFTMQHPDIPPALRGTYAGLAHEAAISHLTQLGVTAVELLPVHEFVPEGFLTGRGLTNYWGYNTIGFFAPSQRYSAEVRAGPATRSWSSRPWSDRCTRPAWRSSWTWCSITPPKVTSWVRRCPSAVSTTRPTTVSTTGTRGTTSTPPAPGTRSTRASRAPCS